jgi:hypothetical protein
MPSSIEIHVESGHLTAIDKKIARFILTNNMQAANSGKKSMELRALGEGRFESTLREKYRDDYGRPAINISKAVFRVNAA